MRRLLVAACTVVALAGGSLATVVAPAAQAAGAAATWTSVTPSPMPPPGVSSSLVFDPATGQLLAYDSYNDSNCTLPQTQVWTWDGAAWTDHQQVTPPQGRDAAIIGSVSEGRAHVVLETELGGERMLEELEDDPLPRIC